jgi:hypothetical protein
VRLVGGRSMDMVFQCPKIHKKRSMILKIQATVVNAFTVQTMFPLNTNTAPTVVKHCYECFITIKKNKLILLVGFLFNHLYLLLKKKSVSYENTILNKTNEQRRDF